MKRNIRQMEKIQFSKIQSLSHRDSGFSLIEIMIAAVILSIGILGVAGLQIIGMKGTHQSYMKQQAMAIVHSLTERMHSNKAGVIAGNYLLANNFDCTVAPPNCSAATANCTPAQIAMIDKHNLVCGYKAGSGQNTGGVKIRNAADISILTNGVLAVTCPQPAGCALGDVRISIQWSEREFSQLETTAPAGTRTDSIVVDTRITP